LRLFDKLLIVVANTEEQAKVKRLRKELERVTEERDI